ncbi:hypothetical protein ACOSQ2_008485 [Xanthoceras sorbifolium]
MVYLLSFFKINGRCIFDLFKLVIDCFEWGEISAAVNQTLITLIPKVPNPLEMANLRPISLCNTTYKIISKIIVARLRQHLPKFISPNQVAFVPERQIQDNIVIAQEVLHKFKTMKGKKGFFVWKIDFAKAYNKLQWGSKPLSLLQVDSLLLILWLLASSFVQCKLSSFPIRFVASLIESTKISCGATLRTRLDLRN